jgi:hypothetical protein
MYPITQPTAYEEKTYQQAKYDLQHKELVTALERAIQTYTKENGDCVIQKFTELLAPIVNHDAQSGVKTTRNYSIGLNLKPSKFNCRHTDCL